MPWKAKEPIGDYKAGDVVPAEKAEVWAKMYLKSPVEQFPDLVLTLPKTEEPPKKEHVLPTMFKKKK